MTSTGAPILCAAAALFVSASLLSGCGTDRGTTRTVATGGSAGSVTSTGGTTSYGGSASGGVTQSGGGGAGGVELPGVGPSALPLIVDSYYAASGYMGDGQVAGNVVMTPTSDTDSKTCNNDRATTTAVGNCHHVTYTVSTTGWAGIYWQYPANNWGAHPGLTVPAGATKVAFYAKGAMGIETVDFSAGLKTTNEPYGDSFTNKTTVNLSTQWQQYSIDLTGMTYDAVIAPFEWAAGAKTNPNPTEFYIDDIHWQ